MAARERSVFELTIKGSDELSSRTYRLDAKSRNILFLIQRGYPSVEAILENTIFPREEVVERLRELLRGHFVSYHSAEPALAPSPMTIDHRTGHSAPGVPASGPETEAPSEPVYFGL